MTTLSRFNDITQQVEAIATSAKGKRKTVNKGSFPVDVIGKAARSYLKESKKAFAGRTPAIVGQLLNAFTRAGLEYAKVNAKVMKDPAMSAENWKDKAMPFDMKHMAYGGFKTIVQR